MAYAYLAADMATGELVPPELPLTSVRWSRQLNGWGQLTGRLHLPPPVNADNRRLVEAYRDATDRKRRVIYVLRDGTPMGAWWITSRRYDLAAQAIEIRADELPAYWSWRLFGWTAPSHLVLRRFGPAPPVQVAYDILASIAPSMGLDMSAVTPPDSGTTTSYEGRLADGKTIGDIVADLSKPEGDLGFDYRVDLQGSGTSFQRRLIMAPRIGGDIGLIAKLTRPHGLGNIVAGEVIEDERRANYVAALGQGDGESRATGEAFSNDWEPRVSTSISVTDETDPAVLSARAAAYLRLVEHISVPTISLRSDQIDAQLGTFAPGDVGRISIEPDTDPWWPDGLWAEQRIISFSVQVPDEGDNETVSFQFDDPAGGFT